jgi:hypothetical protein
MLRVRFPDRGLRVETQPQASAIFPAAHAEVGDIQVCDDGDEVTVYAGSFTHGHFANYDAISDEQKARLISEDVIDFLDAVFADKVAFWGSHKGGGGWRRLDTGSQEKPRASEYVWSGPRRTI